MSYQCQSQSEYQHDNAAGVCTYENIIDEVSEQRNFVQRCSSCRGAKPYNLSSDVYENPRYACECIIWNSYPAFRYPVPEKCRDFDQSQMFDGQGRLSSPLKNVTDQTYQGGPSKNCYGLDNSLEFSPSESDFTWSSIELSESDDSDCEILESCNIREQWERAASWRKMMHKCQCKPEDNASQSGIAPGYHSCETTKHEINREEHTNENYLDHKTHLKCGEFGLNGFSENVPSSGEIHSCMPHIPDDSKVSYEATYFENKKVDIPGEPSWSTCSHDNMDANHGISINYNEQKFLYEEPSLHKHMKPCDFEIDGPFVNKKAVSVESIDNNQEENSSYEKISCLQEQNSTENAGHESTSNLHEQSNIIASDINMDLNADIEENGLCNSNMKITKGLSSYGEEAIIMQGEERLRKRKQGETTRQLDMERRQKIRLKELRELHKKEEENINLKEQIRIKVKEELESIEVRYKDMASLLRGLGIHVEGGLSPMPWQVNVAYKQALVKFHPDRASRMDMLQQIQAEETFKLISRLKEELIPAAY